MGTWGYGNLENDTAADFLGDFREEPTIELLLKPILLVNKAADNDRELAAGDCQEALAAAEIIAASRNQPALNFPAAVQQLVLAFQLPQWEEYKQLMLLTRRAVGVIVEESELRELLADSEEELAEWEGIQQDLQNRLKYHSTYQA